LRPTPLSPACGSRGTLDARRPDAGSDKLLRALKVGFGFARRSRRRRFRRGSGSIARIDLLPPGGSETVLVGLGLIAASALPEGAADSSAPGRQSRPFRLCALAASTVWDLVGTKANLGTFPLLIPPPRGISPSRRYGSEIPSSSPVFRPGCSSCRGKSVRPHISTDFLRPIERAVHPEAIIPPAKTRESDRETREPRTHVPFESKERGRE
jgi:hypothetical protein